MGRSTDQQNLGSFDRRTGRGNIDVGFASAIAYIILASAYDYLEAVEPRL
jgi:hypothetical protein